MEDKTTSVSLENQILMLQAQENQILNAVQRKVIVIKAFPNNKLNPSYWGKIQNAMELYGQVRARKDFLQYELSTKGSEVAA
ncbi:hypothetical protein [Xanthocytophaga flava]|uniref:hypothetical protein n=1 Tax=Xanthocytophaga flava TaxID=3048013 RepID=UPI0028D7D1B2|nr:hypothetical protein [Xanthocytophaga flavus]MDJ1468192.1 hypothetical protein [Xanthocytophaga flavus]